MTVERKLVSALLRGAIEPEQLLSGVANALGVAREDVSRLEDTGAPTPIHVEQVTRPRGFRTSVTLYVDESRARAPNDDAALASLLATQFHQDALAQDPGAVDPYQWLLLRPGKEKYSVSEIPSEDDDAVVVDERPDRMKRLV